MTPIYSLILSTLLISSLTRAVFVYDLLKMTILTLEIDLYRIVFLYLIINGLKHNKSRNAWRKQDENNLVRPNLGKVYS